MADHPDITPEEIAAAAKVYQTTGSYAEAAVAIGRDKSAVRRALIRAGEPLRATLHTHALAKAEREARRALVKSREKLATMLEASSDVKDVTALAAQIHDNARATTTMRTAHARLTGEHAPEKHDVTSGGAALKLYLPDET
jgi:hypothetical protein